MNKKNIELEYRTEIDFESFERIKDSLTRKYKFVSHTKKLSYMGFNDFGNKSIDLRVRIVNGKAEVVIKKGSFNQKDRIEISQEINKDQLVGFVRIFSQIAKISLIAQRATYNFETEDGITISLVRSAHFAYLEFEIVCSKKEIEEKDKIIKAFMEANNYIPVTDKQLDDLCHRMNIHDDWEFKNSKKDVEKLEKLLLSY